MPIHAMDIFAVGRLLHRVYSEGLPAALDKYVAKMLMPDPVKRPTASQYLRCAFLRRQSVKDLSALEVRELRVEGGGVLVLMALVLVVVVVFKFCCC